MILILGLPLAILRVTTLFTIEGFEATEHKENKKEEEKIKSMADPTDEPIVPDQHEVAPDESEVEPDNSQNQESIDNLNPADYETVPVKKTPHKKSRHNSPKSNKPKNKVNYASTYMSNLKKYNDILGNDGLYKMTEHTKDLMQQQNQLGESIAKIVPLIQQMTPFLKTAGTFFNNTANIQTP